MPKVQTLVGAAAAGLLFAAGSAFAGVGGSITPTYPAGPVHVGDTFSASLTITNDSDGANVADGIVVDNIYHTPSCKSGIGSCKVTDPGVFQISAAQGAEQSACAGVNFDVSPIDAVTGEVRFVSQSAWTLGPANNTAGPTVCEIKFTVRVLKAPGQDKVAVKVLRQDPSGSAGTATSSLARASFSNQAKNPQRAAGAGTSSTIVAGAN